jgi:hypothetical protein
MKKIFAIALVIGLVIPTVSHAANNPKKPVVKTASGKEGTATHETTEANTGTGEESTKKVAKAKTSVIKKKGTPKAPKAKK